jgi:hypothetical protein
MNDPPYKYPTLLKQHIDRIGNLSAQITGDIIKDGAHIKNKEEDKRQALYWAVDALEAMIPEKYKDQYKYDDKKSKIDEDEESKLYDKYMAKFNLLVGLIDYKGWLMFEDVVVKIKKGQKGKIQEDIQEVYEED